MTTPASITSSAPDRKHGKMDDKWGPFPAHIMKIRQLEWRHFQSKFFFGYDDTCQNISPCYIWPERTPETVGDIKLQRCIVYSITLSCEGPSVN